MPGRDDALALQYLTPPSQPHWTWSDDGEVVEWIDGTTIAFRAELLRILRRLVPYGLPPFGSIVLLQAACRSNWDVMASEIGVLRNVVTSVARDSESSWLQETAQGLQRVQALPPDLRQSTPARAELAALVFEDAPGRGTPEDAERIVRALEESLPAEALAAAPPRRMSVSDALREFRALYAGLSRVDAEALELRLETGLDRVVTPAPLDLPPAQLVRHLVATLEQDEEHAGLARLAKNLMAIVHLPRAVSEHDDLPVGGVSDIANRGPLDRLLLSELAQDDDVLTVRVALQEALFLRRESPPKQPPRHRALLIDAGIRMWGVPRVFAAAAGLSLAATSDVHAGLLSYRAQGNSVVPIDLTTRAGLVAHLAAVEPETHPGAALLEFLRRVRAGYPPLAKGGSAAAKVGSAAAEVVLITTDAAFADREFQAALAAADCESLFIALVSREGRFRLLAHSRMGNKLLREAEFQVEDLLAPTPRPATPLVNVRADPHLPAFLSLPRLPLLFPHPVDPKSTWSVANHGALSVTRNRRLMHWHKLNFGARQLSDRLPSRHVHWCATKLAEGAVRFVTGRLDRPDLTLVAANLDKGVCEFIPLAVSDGPVLGVCEHGGVIFAIHRETVDLLNPITGTRIEPLPVPSGLQWKRDRFFVNGSTWYALGSDGASAKFQSMYNGDVLRVSVETFFDGMNTNGVFAPVAVWSDGRLHCTHSGMGVSPRFGDAVRVRAIARDGSRIAISPQTASRSGELALIELIAGSSARTTMVRGDPHALVEWAHAEIIRSRNVRTRFQAVFVNRDGNLALIANSGKTVEVQLDTAAGRMFLRPTHPADRCDRRPFAPIPSPEGVGYRLQVAQWRDGSRAYLDSRGLLHLKSSDASISELTLVLAADELAGWCAIGRRFGPTYFTGEERQVSATEIYNTALAPFLRRLT